MRVLERRRSFLTSISVLTALGVVGPGNLLSSGAFGIEPIPRLVPGRMQLSLAAYSLRDLLKGNKDGWDLFKFVDYCHEQGIPGAELTSYYFPADVNDAYIVELKEHCRRRGISVSGGAISPRMIRGLQLGIVASQPCRKLASTPTPKESTWHWKTMAE